MGGATGRVRPGVCSLTTIISQRHHPTLCIPTSTQLSRLALRTLRTLSGRALSPSPYSHSLTRSVSVSITGITLTTKSSDAKRELQHTARSCVLLFQVKITDLLVTLATERSCCTVVGTTIHFGIVSRPARTVIVAREFLIFGLLLLPHRVRSCLRDFLNIFSGKRAQYFLKHRKITFIKNVRMHVYVFLESNAGKLNRYNLTNGAAISHILTHSIVNVTVNCQGIVNILFKKKSRKLVPR